MSKLLHTVNTAGPLSAAFRGAPAAAYLGDSTTAPVMATPTIGAVATAVVGEGVGQAVDVGENLGVSEETQSVVDQYNAEHPVGEE